MSGDPAGFDASAPPVRERGVRSRAGNAMGRTRAAVIDGALQALARNGARKTSMADIAAAAGIAKGTLYNHFRTKEAVFAAALDASIDRLAEQAVKLVADQGLAAGLAHIARTLSDSPVLRSLRAEPAVIVSLLSVSDADAWQPARGGVGELLEQAGARPDPIIVDAVLRWLVSFVASPADGDLDGMAERIALAATAPAQVSVETST